ncbi:adenosine kinase [Planoprotostelium fungivorum]|uniref:Adenosine kinase n=1 Tax=Planoprotostelium fungivorum TaxID=1890364 RepID=A0A2P6MXQ0_9EUKA|nr:adenosine kinase [Planoprotostelium fungivorum]
MSKPVLVGICNPLLDVSAQVPLEVFEQWGVQNGQAILAADQHQPLYAKLQNDYKVEYIAGGAGQNTIRAFSWMTGVPKKGAYIGSVGDDENGKKLREAAEKDGVDVHYYVKEGVPTGSCAVLVHERERALIARLGAAEHYNKSHFESEEIQGLLKGAEFFYATSFVLTHSPNVILSMGQLAAEHNKVLSINISAAFLVQFFWEKLEPVIRYADLIFANEVEAAALGEKLGWGSDLKEIARKLGEYEKENKKRTRTVVFTQGAQETIVYHNGQVTSFQPLKIAVERIVDTNGAGDSFVGGFLSKFVDGKTTDESVAAGHYCASECIQLSGATLPPTNKFSYSQ